MDLPDVFDKDIDSSDEKIERQYLPRDNPIEVTISDIAFIFECKDNCKTILDISHIKDMMRFTAHVVDDPLWK